MQIKTRFAPSPTGYLHIGGIRTALYAWLFAKKHGGTFILRIDDSDIKRSTEYNVSLIIDGMKWLNLNWDEGPYFQSKRYARYKLIINNMLAEGNAYKCFCSKDRLRMLRNFQVENGIKPKYDGHCRMQNLYKYSTHVPYVVRFCNPDTGFVLFNDLIRGPITFTNKELDDLIIQRADGSPTYNFCVVIDDIDMNITHVIRGADHINNTPRQINIFKALGAKIPKYAHVSMVFGSDGKKLSKRNGDKGIIQYRDEGFLPEAILNCVVRLGWSHGDQELFSVEQMQRWFNFNDLSKSASIFDNKKLLWLNHYYINHLSVDYVSRHLMNHILKQSINITNGPLLMDIIQLLGPRYKTLKEIASNCRYFYHDFNEFDNNLAKKYLHPIAQKILQIIRNKLFDLNNWTPNSIKTVIKDVANELKIGMDKICMPLRIAVTGLNHSPILTSTIYFIGKFRVLKRIDMALTYISNNFDN